MGEAEGMDGVEGMGGVDGVGGVATGTVAPAAHAAASRRVMGLEGVRGQTNGAAHTATSVASYLSELRVSAESFKPSSSKSNGINAEVPLDSNIDTALTVDSAQNVNTSSNLLDSASSL